MISKRSVHSSTISLLRCMKRYSSNESILTHIDSRTNEPKQVDVGDKTISPERLAIASGHIQLNQNAFDALVKNKLKKGNALIVAQLAGIQASKITSQLIPLCHQIQLDNCHVEFKADNETTQIRCQATCKTTTSKTGVEMEALVACSISLLTVYDMIKAVQKDAILSDIKLVHKHGGKSDYTLSDSNYKI